MRLADAASTWMCSMSDEAVDAVYRVLKGRFPSDWKDDAIRAAARDVTHLLTKATMPDKGQPYESDICEQCGDRLASRTYVPASLAGELAEALDKIVEVTGTSTEANLIARTALVRYRDEHGPPECDHGLLFGDGPDGGGEVEMTQAFYVPASLADELERSAEAYLAVTEPGFIVGPNDIVRTRADLRAALAHYRSERER